MRAFLISLILVVALTDMALGQTLSIRKGQQEYWIDAKAPAEIRHTLQASANLRLWVDLNEAVWGQASFRMDKAGVTQRFFRLVPWTEPAPEIRIVLLGDSTASDCCGWGQGMYGYFKSNALVANYAMPWFSAKVFLRSAEFDKLQIVKPDFVLVQFGYVDSDASEPERSTTLEEFRANLKTVVETIRGFHGMPILLTVHAARAWDATGKVISSWQDRNAVVKEVAAESETILIDLYELSLRLYHELGPAGSTFMISADIPDSMHFSMQGAKVMSGLVVNALPGSLGPYLVGILDPVTPPGVKNVTPQTIESPNQSKSLRK